MAPREIPWTIPPDIFYGGEKHIQMAIAISRIFIQWGSIEHSIYRVLEAIDVGRWDEEESRQQRTEPERARSERRNRWVQLFFRTRSTDQRAKDALNEIGAEAAKFSSEFKLHADKAFEKYKDIRDRRDALAHGLWRPTDDGFIVFPLRLELNSKEDFEEEIHVNIDLLTELNRDIKNTIDAFAGLCIEMQLEQLQRFNKEASERMRRGK